MSYHQFYSQLNKNARTLFPSLAQVPEISWDMLISPVEVKLSRGVRETCEQAIRALYSVSRRPQYASLLEPVPGISDPPTRHHSVLMAYDFHTSEDGTCALVEVNTNAAGFMLASLMEMTHSAQPTLEFPPLVDLAQAFKNEIQLWGKTSSPSIAIVDEDIEQQKMYAEFLMYRDWFVHHCGWKAELVDSKAFSGAQNFVYNRMTDFYLENPAHAALRDAFVSDRACFSPNPREYWLLGDKQRLIQLGQKEFLDQCGATEAERAAISKVLIPTYDKTFFSGEDEIWSKRKSLFFKPKRSHGGKSVYRGESVSRKVFERLMQEDILIQKFQPAQAVPVDDPRSVLNNWKFDLRFYVYEDRIQLAATRIYQGQVTNFSSPMGGFTLVRF